MPNAAALDAIDLVPIRPATPALVAARAVANAQTGELPSMVTKSMRNEKC